ncbi:MAG: oxidoreductase [Candidatus Sericytochromatia bacterium]|uniref:Oxidoreductase n=1 Tax=Candidatus Tanganyikabacteria bacterium TaxID=2961651 RepID=A0A937X601_9BACT|nr:oxidoreductase [Candidatus Tanganyikabacteria bacterium]
MAERLRNFRALYAQRRDGGYSVAFRDLTAADLPEKGDVLIRVAYSSLNYKDGLAITARGKIIREFPIVPGIDLAGEVVESRTPHFAPGDRVLAIGQGLGEIDWGGYSQMARVRADWVTKIPPPFTPETAMALGTAGFTAMLCVMGLEHQGVVPDSGPVFVTGAGGGVGSIAVLLLARLGYRVVAITGRPEVHDYLRGLGAAEFADRQAFETPGPALQPQRFAGGVDNVGGTILANLIAQTRYEGAVAACGMAHDTDLAVSIFPFILRNVALLGTSSSNTREPKRSHCWDRLARDTDLAMLRRIYRIEPLSRLPELAEDIMAGRIRGRVVVDVNA